MPYVWMDEVPRVQTVGTDGIGMYPPVNTEAVSKISETGREMKEVNAPVNEIPNPGTVNQGAAIVVNNGSYSSGAAGSGSGSGGSGGFEIMMAHVDLGTGLLDKTMGEIRGAFESGVLVFLVFVGDALRIHAGVNQLNEDILYTEPTFFNGIGWGSATFDIPSFDDDYPVLSNEPLLIGGSGGSGDSNLLVVHVVDGEPTSGGGDDSGFDHVV